jgi:hypothetical protein
MSEMIAELNALPDGYRPLSQDNIDKIVATHGEVSEILSSYSYPTRPAYSPRRK